MSVLIELASVGALGCVAFVSTNLDNLVVLTALRASSGDRRVLVGYWASVSLILAIGAGIGLVDSWISPDAVGRLGWIPLGLGVFQLGVFLSGRASGVAERGPVAGAAGALAVFAAMSADSVAVLGPMVADTANRLEWAVLAGWAGMGVVWTWLSGRLATRPAVVAATGPLGAWLAPVLMILVGCYILLDTAYDVLP